MNVELENSVWAVGDGYSVNIKLAGNDYYQFRNVFDKVEHAVAYRDSILKLNPKTILEDALVIGPSGEVVK